MTIYQTGRMRRILPLLLTTILLAGLVTALAYGSALALDPPVEAQDAPPAEAQRDLTIMPLGDSMTLGYLEGLAADDYIGYRGHLQDLLQSAGWNDDEYDFVGSLSHGPVYPGSDPPISVYDSNHEGHGGWHAENDDKPEKDDILSEVYGWLEDVYEDGIDQLDVVLLQIGTNDLGSQDGEGVAEEVKQILHEIDAFEVETWHYPWPIEVVLAQVMHRRDPTASEKRNGIDCDKTICARHKASIAYNEALREVALERMDDVTPLIVVNMAEVIDYPEDYALDKYHPLDSAYRKMARAWYRALDVECTGDGIYLYEDADYTGWCYKWTASDSDLALKWWDNRVSSIKFAGSYRGGNYVVKLYEHRDYNHTLAGGSKTFTADAAYVGDSMNDRTSSIEIDCAGDGIYLYEHRNYNVNKDTQMHKPGWCRKFTASDSGASFSFFDNVASSIKFVGEDFVNNVEVTLFDDYMFKGKPTAFKGNDPDLGNDPIGEDQTSSIRITDLMPLPGPTDGILLCEHIDYGGRCHTFTADEPSFASVGFNDIASSIKFLGSYGGGTYVAKLYEHDDYKGASTVFGANDSDFKDDAIGHDTASSIQITKVPSSPCVGDGIYLYAGMNHTGRCLKFTADEFDLLPWAFNDVASSVKFVGADLVGKVEVVLFEHIMFRGKSTTLTGNDPNLGDNPIGENEASSIAIWPRTKAWTFLLYLDGDNNLSRKLNKRSWDLQWNAQVNGDIAIAVLLDGDGPDDTWRGRIFPGSGALTPGDTQWYIGERDMGDAQTLADFVRWGRQQYPAEHYYLAIADHGNGVVGTSWDDHPSRTPPSRLTVQELQEALDVATGNAPQRAKIDIVHYDSCLMAMLENAYDIREYADYLIASQNVGWTAFGYAYYSTEADRWATPRDLASDVADIYSSLITGRPGTVSVMDLSQAADVKDEVDSLAVALRTKVPAGLLRQIRGDVQKFDSNASDDLTDEDDYVDLCHLASLVYDRAPTDAIRSNAQALRGEACANGEGQRLVLKEQHASADIWKIDPVTQFVEPLHVNLDNAQGVSIYWPQTSGGLNYNDYVGGGLYAFTGDTQWDEFVQAYALASGVPPRPDADQLPLAQMWTRYEVFVPIVSK